MTHTCIGYLGFNLKFLILKIYDGDEYMILLNELGKYYLLNIKDDTKNMMSIFMR